MSHSSPPDLPKKSKEAEDKERLKAIEALWKKSVLYWKLDKNQMEMYKFAREHPEQIIVIGSSRQLGKSFFLTTLAIEECLRNPFSIVKFVAPKVKDIRRIITPLIREITADCPKELKPKYKSQEHIFSFPNGSEIQLAGTDNGHAESIRGTKANLCIIDEAGFCSDLDYVVNSILIPTTTTTGGKIIMSSTPSKSPDHPFMKFLAQAQLENRFIKKTIFDNPRLTKAHIDNLARALGGYESVDFKREYLVELLISEDDAVVPEFSKELQLKVVKEQPHPPYYDCYVAMDIGITDLTAVLFAYYDFVNGTLIIEDELVLKGQAMLTDNLALLIKEKEKALWSHKYTGEAKQVHLRVADNNNPILLQDLAVKHGITFMPTLKDNKHAAINNMRMLLKSEKILINPKCKNLIYHLESAIWAKDRNNFARSADKGHFDFVDSLSYLCRNVNFNKNPYPENYNFIGKGPVFFNEPESKASNHFEKQLETMVKERNPFKSGTKYRRY